MGTAVLELPRGTCPPVEVGEIGAFFEPAPSSDEVLGGKAGRLIHGLLDVLETCLLAAISARSLKEFNRERKRGWPKYVRALRALQDTFSILVPETVREELSAAATSSLESDIQRKGEAVFGDTLAMQASFTLWTIGEIRVLGQQISRQKVSEADRAKDRSLVEEYQINSLWAQFHLDCLAAALKFDLPIRTEIRSEMCEGLRSAVNAYAIMKDAETLRTPPTSAENITPVILPWDEEDEHLLNSSMRDINADFTKGS